MNVDSYILKTPLEGDTFLATAKRYRPRLIERNPEDPGHIVLFAHGIGFHKEAWEPTIEHLFEIDNANKGSARILEAWAIDAPNHGENAQLNDTIFSQKQDILTIHHYADIFVELYRSGLLGKLENGHQKLVLVGHSAGSVGVIYAAVQFLPSTPFSMLILVDPPLYTSTNAERMTDTYRIVAKTTPSRRSIWSSKTEAHDWLRSRVPWKVWDPRILGLYCQYALRPLPTLSVPNGQGVILSCNPAQEAAAFTRPLHTIQAVDHLKELCRRVPIHLVFGAKNDMFSREVQDSIHDPKAGRVMASVTRIKGAGHLIPQEKPKDLSEALHAILDGRHAARDSKL